MASNVQGLNLEKACDSRRKYLRQTFRYQIVIESNGSGFEVARVPSFVVLFPPTCSRVRLFALLDQKKSSQLVTLKNILHPFGIWKESPTDPFVFFASLPTPRILCLLTSSFRKVQLESSGHWHYFVPRLLPQPVAHTSK